MSEAIRINNLAISRMERRDYKSAMSLMSESMSILKEDGTDQDLLPQPVFLQQQEADKSAAQEAESRSSPSVEIEAMHVPAVKRSASPSDSITSEQAHQDVLLEDSLSVFKCPLRIHPGTVVADDTCAQVCAILMYNCAMAYHLNGLEESDLEARDTKLQQALYLYQAAHGIHLNNQVEQVDNVDFTLAILNNVGQIHDLLGNISVSKRCFGRMLRILMMFVETNRSEDVTARMELFFLNISRFILEKPAAPAA